MSVGNQTVGDGSALADAERVRVDREEWPWRYTCPNGHTQWERTNNHVWCQGCQRAARQGASVEAEHYAIYDKREGREIPWSSVVIVDGGD